MNKLVILGFLYVSATLIFHFSQSTTVEYSTIPDPTTILPLVSVITSEMEKTNTENFASALYEQIRVQGQNANIIISPLSIETACGMCLMGARGSTANELIHGLRLKSSDTKQFSKNAKEFYERYQNNPMLTIANKIYVGDQQNLRQDYLDTLNKNFLAEAETINFVNNTFAANNINNWVEMKTNGKIKDLISSDSLNQDTAAVILNAIHFKGMWRNQFDKQATRKSLFWIDNNNNVEIDMMKTKQKYDYGIFDEINAKAIDMPYKDSDLSMFILLPNEKNGLPELESKLSNISLGELSKKMYSQELNVEMPKFKIEFSIDLRNVFEKMGMKEMFTNKADFGNMIKEGDKPLKVSKVIHKAFIEVNEEGAEAAAATGMIMFMRCSLPIDLEFIANHPFLYFLWNKNEQKIIFMGRYIHS